MENIKKEILACLKKIKGGGSFYSSGAMNFVFPNMSIEGIGELSYPINEGMARQLISVASKAAYGKGHETIIDAKVRSAWEIDVSAIKFEGENWSLLIGKIVGKLKEDMGLEEYNIEPQLYKLLIYEEDDFFLKHKDSEKENGMFGTLIVALPSKHTGGKLVVSFDGEEREIYFAPDSSQGKIAYACFYADCDHEVLKLTKGYRVVLVYNLIQKATEKKIELQSFSQHVECLSAQFDEIGISLYSKTSPTILLLDHQYTPTNFKESMLKLNDRAKAKVIIQAARKSGLYANICLVTSMKEGTPEFYDEDDCDVMGEVNNEELYLENWCTESLPDLGHIYLDEDDIISSFDFDEGDPFEAENTGYMGNYGPDVVYWYHYAGVALWSHEQHTYYLLDAKAERKIQWLNHYNLQWQNLAEREKNMARDIVKSFILNVDLDSEVNVDAVIQWLILENDIGLLKTSGFVFLESYFPQIIMESWIKLAQHYGISTINDFFTNHIKTWDKKKTNQLIDNLYGMSLESAYSDFVLRQVALLPIHYKSFVTPFEKEPISSINLQKLFEIEESIPQSTEWVKAMYDLLTKSDCHKYLTEVMAKTVLENSMPTPLKTLIYEETIHRVKQRVENKPQPPSTWSMPVPQDHIYGHLWKILEDFFRSPTQTVFDYRKVKQEREDMFHALRKSGMDLKTETIKIGSPHILRITKTQDSYLKKMEVWKKDVRLLERLEMGV